MISLKDFVSYLNNYELADLIILANKRLIQIGYPCAINTDESFQNNDDRELVVPLFMKFGGVNDEEANVLFDKLVEGKLNRIIIKTNSVPASKIRNLFKSAGINLMFPVDNNKLIISS